MDFSQAVRTAADARRAWRAEVLPTLVGTVVDIGAGEGQSAPHLHPDVRWIAVEPAISATLRAAVAKRANAELIRGVGEHVPVDDDTADAVVLCTVLCSVRDQAAVLAEVIRILRPGGRLVFFEHVGAARGTWTRALQTLYRPYGRWFDAGCDPTRDTESSVRRAGFTSVDLARTTFPGWLGSSEPLVHGSALA